MGTCTGITSACALAGYALESRCHLGNVLRYDTISERGWSTGLTTHPIIFVVENLLAEDWSEEKEVPDFVNEDDCIVRIPFFLPTFSFIDGAMRLGLL